MQQRSVLVLLLTLAPMHLAACGDDTDGDTDADAGADASAPAATALEYTGDFTMGDTVAPKHKCLMSVVGSGMGDNISPELSWRGGPEETMGWAVVLYDTRWASFHWALWDIPALSRDIPEGIAVGYDVSDPVGAHQVNTRGENEYFGPCSDAGTLAGVYEYRLHALDTDELELTETSSPDEAQAAIEAATIETILWEGTPE